MTSASAASPTRAVDRALDLLAEVCTQERASLTECARRASLSPSTALRLLRTLEAKAFVTRDADGLFHSGPRLLQLGAASFGRQSLVQLAEPALQRLVAACGESAYLSVRGPGETAIYVAMVEGTYPIRHTGWVGRAVQLRGTAIGQAMLARELADGYVAQSSELEPDITAIAAPVRRPSDSAKDGSVAAVLSVIGPSYRLGGAVDLSDRTGAVIGPSYRMGDQRLHELGRLVADEAQVLAEQVGGAAPVARRRKKVAGE